MTSTLTVLTWTHTQIHTHSDMYPCGHILTHTHTPYTIHTHSHTHVIHTHVSRPIHTSGTETGGHTENKRHTENRHRHKVTVTHSHTHTGAQTRTCPIWTETVQSHRHRKQRNTFTGSHERECGRQHPSLPLTPTPFSTYTPPCCPGGAQRILGSDLETETETGWGLGQPPTPGCLARPSSGFLFVRVTGGPRGAGGWGAVRRGGADTNGWEVGRDFTFTQHHYCSTSQSRRLRPTGGEFFPKDTLGAFGTMSKRSTGW